MLLSLRSELRSMEDREADTRVRDGFDSMVAICPCHPRDFVRERHMLLHPHAAVPPAALHSLIENLFLVLETQVAKTTARSRCSRHRVVQLVHVGVLHVLVAGLSWYDGLLPMPLPKVSCTWDLPLQGVARAFYHRCDFFKHLEMDTRCAVLWWTACVACRVSFAARTGADGQRQARAFQKRAGHLSEGPRWSRARPRECHRLQGR